MGFWTRQWNYSTTAEKLAFVMTAVAAFAVLLVFSFVV